MKTLLSVCQLLSAMEATVYKWRIKTRIQDDSGYRLADSLGYADTCAAKEFGPQYSSLLYKIPPVFNEFILFLCMYPIRTAAYWTFWLLLPKML